MKAAERQRAIDEEAAMIAEEEAKQEAESARLRKEADQEAARVAAAEASTSILFEP